MHVMHLEIQLHMCTQLGFAYFGGQGKWISHIDHKVPLADPSSFGKLHQFNLLVWIQISAHHIRSDTLHRTKSNTHHII